MDLGDGEVKGSEGGLETAWFEAVGIAVSVLDATLMRSGTDVVFPFEEHGGVHEEFGDLWNGVFEAIGKKKVDE